MNWFAIGGSTRRIACGRMTKRMRCQGLRPSAMAASRWPCSTDWMPARKISASKALSQTAIASIAAMKTPSRMSSTTGSP